MQNELVAEGGRAEPSAELRRRVGLAIALGLVFLLFNVWDLTLYPLVADDEVLLNEPARVLAVNGTLESPLLSPDHVPGHVLVQPPIQALAVAAIYAAAGFGIWQTRLASLLWGVLAIGIVTFVASGIGAGPLAGVLAAVLLALNPSFALSVRMGRVDALCLAFAVFAFGVLLQRGDRSSSRFAAFAAGVLTALACLTHFVAFGFLAGMLLVVVLGPAPRWRTLFEFIAGGATVAGLWGIFLAWQGWDSFATLLSHGSMRSAGGTLGEKVRLEAWRWLIEGRSYAGIVACYTAGLVYAVRRAEPQDTHPLRAAAIVAGTMLVFNTLAMSKVSGYYPPLSGHISHAARRDVPCRAHTFVATPWNLCEGAPRRRRRLIVAGAPRPARGGRLRSA